MGLYVKPIVIFFLIIGIHSISEEKFDEFAEYMRNKINNADNGHLATDSYSFKPLNNKPPKDFGTFDFIIVGAGATGSVIANRLSEKKCWKILLLEAGGYPSRFTDMPVNSIRSRLTKYNWGYLSEPQKYSCLGSRNEQCMYARGQGLGGTTLINGLVYSRGHPLDFDRWAAMGNPGWSYKDVLPLFKKSEGLLKNNPAAVVDWEYHNSAGPMHVEYIPTSDPQLNAWFEAQKTLKYNSTDTNSPKQVGFTHKPSCTRSGKRQDDATAFILPILTRTNLFVQTNALVTKIIIDENQISAKGVEFSYNRTIYRAFAKKEVIVSSGAINTPQLLMLSGIGPKDHLKEKCIKLVKDLPVGETLREHSAFWGLVFSTNYTEPIKPFKEYIREYLNGVGPFTIADGLRGISFFNTKYEPNPEYPDVEVIYFAGNCTSASAINTFHLKEETYNATFSTLEPAKCFQAAPVALHAQSVGYIKLKTNSPYDFPLINPNHLSDKDHKDIDTLYESIQLILKLTETDAMKKVDAKLGANPLPACKQHEFLSKDYWYCALGQLTMNMYHPVGSCPMGPDAKKAVVNHELKVYGVKKLRVADASVFPLTLAGHPNAPCVMIGEKLAELLKRDYSF
ncbi:unnamed protein product [Brassicogethes aeneus]|uniref:Glucose-methanol-choline oxidoreductase N-terminal domain-containing protein n=1 Tax=Brassicogethes aeneus TaxID=1431903 RepID=A0A9P0B1X6_BRAAE|nr:unnamed protein product [Brassicogethes aeneus]